MEDTKESSSAPAGEEDNGETKAEQLNGADDRDAEEEEKETGDDGDTKKRKRGTEPDEASSPAAGGGEKRARPRRSAAVDAYKPEDFAHVDNSPHHIGGKGTPLSEMSKVKETIESFKDNSEELQMAYRFLFLSRGRGNHKEIKPNLLKFNGYIPKPEEGMEEDEIDKMEKAAEKKYATKAYKLSIPQLKKMCDIFAVDRSGVTNKDGLVDTLLDFLSEPDEKLTRGSRKKAAKKSSSSKSKESSLDDYEEIVEGVMPTDTQLRQWVRAYVRCFNTSRKSLKDAMEIAEEKFGVDLSEKKKRIKELLTEEL